MSDDMQARIDQLVTLVDGLSPATVSKPTLVYFDVVGIAWPIRCLLHMHNIDYDYVPLTIFEWMHELPDGSKPLKSAFENGHVPLYVDSEVSLNQSTLIVKTLAQRHGLMGSNASEALQIESMLAHCYDALFHWNGLLTVNIRLNISDKVAQARLDSFMGNGVWGLTTDGYRNHLDAFVAMLQANTTNSGFMVGEQLSAADLSAFNVLCNWYKAFDRQVFTTEYPQLEDYIQRIAKIPAIADYIRNVQEPTLWFNLPTVALRLTSPEELQGLVELA